MRNFIGIFTGPSGRLNRARFWLGVLVTAIVGAVLIIAGFAAGLSRTRTGTTTTTMSDGTVSTSQVTTSILLPLPTFIIGLVVSALLLVPLVKRRHDRGNSGVDAGIIVIGGVLLQLAVLLAVDSRAISLLSGLDGLGYLYLFVVAGCLKGTIGPNRYGPDPLAA